jgi:hypothetical protein
MPPENNDVPGGGGDKVVVTGHEVNGRNDLPEQPCSML